MMTRYQHEPFHVAKGKIYRCHKAFSAAINKNAAIYSFLKRRNFHLKNISRD